MKKSAWINAILDFIEVMSEGNLSDRRRQKDANRRDLLVLVHAYLLEEGLAEAAQAVRENWNFDNYEVCDNVDLQLILMEYQGFYQVRQLKRSLMHSGK